MKSKIVIILSSLLIITACSAASTEPIEVDEKIVIDHLEHPDLYQKITKLVISPTEEPIGVIRYTTGSLNHQLRTIQTNQETTDSQEFFHIKDIHFTSNGDIYYIGEKDQDISLVKNQEIILTDSSIQNIYLSPTEEIYLRFKKDGQQIIQQLDGQEIANFDLIDEIAFDQQGNIAYTYLENDNWKINYQDTPSEAYSFISPPVFNSEGQIGYISADQDRNFQIHIADKITPLPDKYAEIGDLAFSAPNKLTFTALDAETELWTLYINDKGALQSQFLRELVGNEKGLYVVGMQQVEVGNGTQQISFVFDVQNRQEIQQGPGVNNLYVAADGTPYYTLQDSVGLWHLYQGAAEAVNPAREDLGGYIQISNFKETAEGMELLAELSNGDVVLVEIN